MIPSMTADDDHPFDPAPLLASAWASSPRPSGSCRAYCAATARTPSPRLARRLPVSPPAPVDVPHGLDSPVGRVYELDGQVLLLGVDHTANTTIHLGEYMEDAPATGAKYVTLLKRAAYPGSITLRLITAARTFSLVDGWLESEGLQRRGPVGRAEAKAGPIERCDPGGRKKFNRTRPSFSSPFGVDEECDDARLSLSEE